MENFRSRLRFYFFGLLGVGGLTGLCWVIQTVIEKAGSVAEFFLFPVNFAAHAGVMFIPILFLPPLIVMALLDALLSMFGISSYRLALGFGTVTFLGILMWKVITVEMGAQKAEKELTAALEGTTPFFSPVRFVTQPTEWKLGEHSGSHAQALMFCSSLGADWRIPQREELLYLLPEIRKTSGTTLHRAIWLHAKGPAIVDLLGNEYSRGDGGRFICVRGDQPINLLNGKNWKQMGLYANWFDARRECQKLGRKWNIPSREQWRKMGAEIPKNSKGVAWTGDHTQEADWTGYQPQDAFALNLETRRFEEVLVINERRLEVFCAEN